MMEFKNVQEAWVGMASNVINFGDEVNGTLELNNISFTIENPIDNIVRCRDNFSLPYYLGETIWYGAGSDETSFISKFGKIWNKLSDDGKTNNSAYGYILKSKHGFNQIYKMAELLSFDPNSRRAVMNINVPNKNVIDTKDEMCTIALQFLLRDGKLNMTGIMRSNDLWTGTPYDLFYFTAIQQKVAKMLDVEVGTYTHFVTSLHIYDRDIDKVKKSLDNYCEGKNADIEINALKLLEKAPNLYWDLYKYGSEDIKKEVVAQCYDLGIIWGTEIDNVLYGGIKK